MTHGSHDPALGSHAGVPGQDAYNECKGTGPVPCDDTSPQHHRQQHDVAACEHIAPKPGRCVRKVEQFNRFVDEALAGLPPTAAVLWLTLFRFAKNGIAKVSQQTLAGRLGVDVKTVRRNLEVLLAKKGLVRIKKQGAKGRGCSVYQLGITPLGPRAKPNRRKQPPR